MFTNSDVASVVDDDRVKIKSMRRYFREREREWRDERWSACKHSEMKCGEEYPWRAFRDRCREYPRVTFILKCSCTVFIPTAKGRGTVMTGCSHCQSTGSNT